MHYGKENPDSFPNTSDNFRQLSEYFPDGGLGRGETASLQGSGGSRLRMRDGTTTIHRVSCNKCLYSKSKQHPRENDLQTQSGEWIETVSHLVRDLHA